MKIKKICQQCGKEFQVPPCFSRYNSCSIDCKKAFNKKKAKRNCEFCGAVFYRPPSNCQGGRGKYCSRDCYNQAQRKNYRNCSICGKQFYDRKNRNSKCAEHRQLKDRTRYYALCPECGAVFEWRVTINAGGRIYCSKKCAYRHMPRPPLRELKNYKCNYCGKQISRWAHQKKDRKRFFCSPECSSAFYFDNENFLTVFFKSNMFGKNKSNLSDIEQKLIKAKVLMYKIRRSSNV